MKELYLIIWNSPIDTGIQISRTFNYDDHIEICKQLNELKIPFTTACVKIPNHILK